MIDFKDITLQDKDNHHGIYNEQLSPQLRPFFLQPL